MDVITSYVSVGRNGVGSVVRPIKGSGGKEIICIKRLASTIGSILGRGKCRSISSTRKLRKLRRISGIA